MVQKRLLICMRILLLVCSFLVLFSHSSCKKYAPAPDAFFIKSSHVRVNPTSNKQGTANHKISDLWLYVDGMFQGAFPVGNALPIISNNKKVRIEVWAGIKNNGISDTRIYWPFFEIIKFDTLVENGKTINRDFTFQYAASTNFTWTENFESSTQSGYTIQKSTISSVSPKIKSDHNSLEGRYLELYLAGDSTIGRVQSSGSGYYLPKGSSNVYLELNYKCSKEISVGLLGDGGKVKPVVYLKEQPDWNKIYIQLSAVINEEPVSNKYNIYFQILRSESEKEANLCIDNIKLLYLE